MSLDELIHLFPYPVWNTRVSRLVDRSDTGQGTTGQSSWSQWTACCDFLANLTGDDGQAEADVTPGSDHFVAMTLTRVASPMAVTRSPCHRFGPSPVGSENCSRKAS